MKASALLAAALSGSLLVGCADRASLPQEVVHPSIVSLNPCTDAILAEVAEPRQILAISYYSHDPRSSSMEPAAARRFPATGGTAEEVLALRPDMVIAGSFLPPATAQAFRRLGIRVETFPIASSIAESKAQVVRIAVLAGGVDEGAALNRRIEAALVAAAPAPGARHIDALVWQQGGIVAGPDSLIADLLTHTGFSSHAAARGLGQGAYLPLEQVLANPPELILAAGDQRALTHPALSALATTRRETLDPSLLFCGGPTIIRAARRLAEIRRGGES